jgi:hypothetical protein
MSEPGMNPAIQHRGLGCHCIDLHILELRHFRAPKSQHSKLVIFCNECLCISLFVVKGFDQMKTATFEFGYK